MKHVQDVARAAAPNPVPMRALQHAGAASGRSRRRMAQALASVALGASLAVAPTTPAGALTASPVNTGIVANGVTAAGATLATTVSERSSGRDLSGDGDTDDNVLVLVDPATGEAQSSQITVDPGVRGLADGTLLLSRSGVLHFYDVATSGLSNTGVSGFQVEAVLPDGRIALSLSERHADGDLNGDGDRFDFVLHLFDRRTNGLLNLGRVAYSITVAGGDLLFAVPESQQGSDLNGDGDGLDNVAAVHDLVSGTTTNLGLATYASISPLATDGADATFSVSEYMMGSDLNRDGDQDDEVLHLFEGTSDTATNTEISAQSPTVAGPRTIVVARFEQQDPMDLNGDGDREDIVLQSVDAITGVTTNLRVAGAAPQSLGGGRVGFTTFERWSTSDHNGDGDTRDQAVGVVDLATRAAVHSGTAAADSPYGWSPVSGGAIAFAADEGAHGADLSGDGDTDDQVMQIFTSATGATVSTGIPYRASAPIQVLPDRRLAWVTPEHAVGAGIDHNGDGDRSDGVPVVYDLATARSSIVPLASVYGPQLVGGAVVLPVPEWMQDADLDGDGDRSDNVLHIVRIADGTPDADGDGLPDDRDPDEITAIVLALPRASFSSTGHPGAFASNLDRIEALIVAGDVDGAITELQALRRRVDGCNGTTKEKADRNDWISVCADQRTVRAAIDQLVATLRSP